MIIISTDLDEICKNIDLLEYVSRSIEMKQKGRDWFGKCPLHVDKTPSFSITPKKNSFYCFSCGRGGGIIKYLMAYEKLNFDEAVEKASKLANIDISKMCKSKTVSYLKNIKNANRERNKDKYEHKILDKTKLESFKRGDIEVWKEEGIKQDVMDIFEIRIDTWSNRIVYPVYDTNGNLINIKGRTLYKDFKEKRIPKYINYYEVGVMDYFQGLNVTLPYIKEKNEVIIFESLKSVMKAFGWGYKNCISAEKHVLTTEQIHLIAKLNVNVVLAYDSDINYFAKPVIEDINKLKRITNVYYINDTKNLLGGIAGKNAPVDVNLETWENLYNMKVKIVNDIH